MEELKTFDRLDVKIDRTDCGIITRLIADAGITDHGNIEWNGKTVLANYFYKKDGTYELVYSIIDLDGKVKGNYLENNGILPTLFKSPGNELYVSVIPYDPDKELEISIPLLNRALIQESKRNRPFSGKYIGNINQSSIFHDVDIFSDKKQDKLLNIEFKNGTIKKKHNIKIDFPKDNKIFTGNNEIHLLANDKSIYIHRQIDEFGKEIKKREIKFDNLWCREILSLTFDGNSRLISSDGGKIILFEVDGNGKYKSKKLLDIEDEIYNTWKPIEIGNNTFVIQFNTEFGNGWFVINGNELAEFYYGKGKKGYKNLLTGKVIDMGNNNLIISGINKTESNNYAVIFYDNVKSEKPNKEIIILNKRII
jgi:hypothetical protein